MCSNCHRHSWRPLSTASRQEHEGQSRVPLIQPPEQPRMHPLSCRLPRSYQLHREATTMIPTEVFDAFAQGDYIPLMAQAAMENALSPRLLDRLFEDTAQRQFTRDLLFSSVVGLM